MKGQRRRADSRKTYLVPKPDQDHILAHVRLKVLGLFLNKTGVADGPEDGADQDQEADNDLVADEDCSVSHIELQGRASSGSMLDTPIGTVFGRPNDATRPSWVAWRAFDSASSMAITIHSGA